MLTPLLAVLLAQPAPPEDAAITPPPAPASVPAAAELLNGAVPLNEAGTVLLDRENKRAVIKGEVCLRSGPLEMLLCLPQTKEHESILKYEGDARTLHAALVAAGMQPGEPVTFDPEFAPPKGPKLNLTLYWTDAEGVARRVDARDWVRTSTDKWYERDLAALPPGVSLPEDLELRYDAPNTDLLWYGRMSEAERDRALALSNDGQFQEHIRSFYEESQPRPLTADFVFAGSFLYDKPVAYNAEGEVTETVRTYAAEGGEVVCVANFPAATIDIAERSSAEGENVLYEAATERIPPIGTPVIITFEQRPEPAAADGTKPTAPQPPKEEAATEVPGATGD
ncbi:YdjY domain-containing protein [Alienimonas sp. DA493]|uniref:YdjY domain-containing protein n=1 Tax=Alienimonas sp. DA493 TaxID=3373605 RepID=UPI003754EB97